MSVRFRPKADTKSLWFLGPDAAEVFAVHCEQIFEIAQEPFSQLG